MATDVGTDSAGSMGGAGNGRCEVETSWLGNLATIWTRWFGPTRRSVLLAASVTSVSALSIHAAPYALESVGLGGWSRSVVSGCALTKAWMFPRYLLPPGWSLSRESKRASTCCGPAPITATTLPRAFSATLVGPVTSPSGDEAEGRPAAKVRTDPLSMTVTRPDPGLPVPASATNTRPSAPTAMPRGLLRPLAATHTDGPAARTGVTIKARMVKALARA